MNATVMARPISSIIPGARERISLIAPVRNGRPPQKYITVPRTGDTHCDPGKLRHGVAEDHREHAGQRDRRDGQHKHGPEQPAELRDVIAVPAVAGMTVSAACSPWSTCAWCCEWLTSVMPDTLYPLGVYGQARSASRGSRKARNAASRRHPWAGRPSADRSTDRAPPAMCRPSGRCPVTRTAICETGTPAIWR